MCILTFLAQKRPTFMPNLHDRYDRFLVINYE